MGADGGSIPDRRDLVRTKAKSEQTDKELLRELFFLCALSKRPLNQPVVLDPLGKLYNKDALLEYLLDKSKYGDGDLICGYLKGMKDVITLNVTPNPTYSPPDPATTQLVPLRAPFVCPLSLREMSGTIPFIALRPCGCVFSEAAVRSVIPNLAKAPTTLPATGAKSNPAEGKDKVACPNCGKDIDPRDEKCVMPINPRKEVQDVLLEEYLFAKAAAKAGKKRKAIAISGGMDGNTVVKDNGHADTRKLDKDDAAAILTRKVPRTTASASPAPSNRAINGHSGRNTPDPANLPSINQRQTVSQKLAEQEEKRKVAREGMSDAVKSIFAPKDSRNGTATSNAASDFFGRTFTRYA